MFMVTVASASRLRQEGNVYSALGGACLRQEGHVKQDGRQTSRNSTPDMCEIPRLLNIAILTEGESAASRAE